MKKLICILFSFSGFLIVPAFGQNDTVDVTYEVTDTMNKDIRLFERDNLLELSLRFDITTYKRTRSDKEYLDAILTYHISDTDSINKAVKLRSRGIMRRNYCDFPPIRLNFKKAESPNDEFRNLDKLKVVTHCKLGNEDYTLREYLVYKLYNVLTDNSFKVRLARINYINTSKESKPVKEYAFVIEPVNVLAKRTNAVELNVTALSQKHVKPEMMDRFAIFNYMIGNTDWSVPGFHNALVLAQPRSDRPDLGMIVPFDFDYSGLVNTDYAVPTEALPIETVRDRLYMGVCRTEEEFKNTVKEFADKKEEFFKVINDFPYLKERSKKDMIMYLNGFFNDFDKRNTIVYKLLNQCKTI